MLCVNSMMTQFLEGISEQGKGEEKEHRWDVQQPASQGCDHGCWSSTPTDTCDRLWDIFGVRCTVCKLGTTTQPMRMRLKPVSWTRKQVRAQDQARAVINGQGLGGVFRPSQPQRAFLCSATSPASSQCEQ